MLKKLLPSIFDKKKDQAQNQQSQTQEKQENQKQSEGSIEFGSNLVSNSQHGSFILRNVVLIISVIRKFIISSSVAFGILLLLNFGLSFIIDFQKSLQEDYLKKIESYSDVEVRAKDIDAKTVAYKRFSNERRKISSKTKFVLENMGSNIELKSLSINHESFSISVKGDNAISFTNLIMRYLEEGMVSEIIIRSASLNKSENKFDVNMEGVFK